MLKSFIFTIGGSFVRLQILKTQGFLQKLIRCLHHFRIKKLDFKTNKSQEAYK
jgi:hypothetical protein